MYKLHSEVEEWYLQEEHLCENPGYEPEISQNLVCCLIVILSRGGGVVPHEAHNLETPVRVRPPQQITCRSLLVGPDSDRKGVGETLVSP